MKLIYTLFIGIMLAAATLGAEPEKNWRVYFSPHGGCTEAVVDAVNHAQSTVLMQAYSFISNNSQSQH